MHLNVVLETVDGSPIDSPDWRVELEVTPVGADERAVQLRVQYDGAAPADARVRLEVAAPDAPYWLIPGLFYGANRDPACARLYPRYAPGELDAENLIADRWAFRADRAATPVVFAWGEEGGVALSVGATTSLGLSGLGLGAGPDRPATIWASLPYREEPFSYVGEPRGVEPLADCHRWEQGECHEIQASLWTLPADRHSYAPVLQVLRDRERAAHPPVTPWVDIADAAELTAYGLWRWHYRENPAVLIETALFDRELAGDLGDRGDRLAMHVAWVSGIPYAHALLRHGRRAGNPSYVEAGTAVIDHITANLTPAGTFFGTWYAEKGWKQSWTPVPGGLHARTLAEATLFTLRAIAAEPVEHPVWRTAALSNLEFALAAQDAEGNFGSMYHLETGEVLSRLGAAGLTWVGAMAEAYELFGDERFREAARRGGRYYASFVRDETLCGAPEDVDLAPTSEDGYAALFAYVGLHRIDPSSEWLALARHGADWMLTFRYSYDVRFDPETILGAYGFRSRGADQASPSNQHLHNYGLICTAELATLSALTGDDSYATSAAEHLRFARQFIARHDGDFNARRGMVTERYYQTECFGPPGALLTLSHSWCIGVLLLATEDALTHPELTTLTW
ncbi:hypothetical protein EV651_111220 [Kribbella sp. VKM Ac-2571]|uniref:hypothetical protein n=1 Tax=Kribbella sp. VKM Ac-2571 TaxID=2512222 RepID=UPI00105D9695|nr:hypothetical protein [Kribbella sp. VKM Ac-2571]TDO57494.1 hypothetical protein EV651_111220 [Kribbella sp. VKM Ac-2571]